MALSINNLGLLAVYCAIIKKMTWNIHHRYVVMTAQELIKVPCSEFQSLLSSLKSQFTHSCSIMQDVPLYLCIDLPMIRSLAILFLHWKLARGKFIESFFIHRGQLLGQVCCRFVRESKLYLWAIPYQSLPSHRAS